MKKNYTLSLILLVFIIGKLSGQCPTITGTNGRTVNVVLSNFTLIKPSPCPTNQTSWNYNVSFNYTVTINGGSMNIYTLQGNTKCNSGSQFFDLPNSAGSGTATTSNATKNNSSAATNLQDCTNATLTSLGCNDVEIIIGGDFIGNQTIICSSVLPIHLIKFNGKYAGNENKITLNWSTASEENGSHFDILRSIDGVNFQKIGQIASQQNSRIRNDYEFVDGNFNDAITYYYQLKMVDLDESYKMSDIVSVEVANKDFSQVMATPNPSENGVFNLFIPLELANESKNISIYGQNMQLILDQKINNGTAKVDLSNHANGIYLLKVGSSVTKLVKTN